MYSSKHKKISNVLDIPAQIISKLREIFELPLPITKDNYITVNEQKLMTELEQVIINHTKDYV